MSDKVSNPDLRAELLKRKEKDQKLRKDLFGALASGELDQESDECKRLSDELEATDKENTAWIKSVIDEHDWLDQSLVGKEGEKAAWLLVQHADHDVQFQKRGLSLLKEAMKKGVADPAHVAYLSDRIRSHQGDCQMYGTQFRGKETGGVEPFPICDEDKLEERRKEMGLQPFEDYKQKIKEINE